MSAVKRVQKLLKEAEKRATGKIDPVKGKGGDKEKLAKVAASVDRKQKEEVMIKATGRAMEKGMNLAKWFREKGEEYVVEVKTGSLMVVDDIVEDEAEKERLKMQREQGIGKGPDAGAATDGAEDAAATRKAKLGKRGKDVIGDNDELPESRTRWINTIEVAVSIK